MYWMCFLGVQISSQEVFGCLRNEYYSWWLNHPSEKFYCSHPGSNHWNSTCWTKKHKKPLKPTCMQLITIPLFHCEDSPTLLSFQLNMIRFFRGQTFFCATAHCLSFRLNNFRDVYHMYICICIYIYRYLRTMYILYNICYMYWTPA